MSTEEFESRSAWTTLWDRLHEDAEQYESIRKLQSDFSEKNHLADIETGLRAAIAHMERLGGRNPR